MTVLQEKFKEAYVTGDTEGNGTRSALKRHFVDGLKSMAWSCFWLRQKINARKAIELLNRLKPHLLDSKDVEFIRRLSSLFEWLEQPENQELWKKPRRTIPGERSTAEYLAWRIAVFGRDGYKCQQCGSKKELHAHHKMNYAGNKELRTVIDNGITLCKKCHQSLKRIA